MAAGDGAGVAPDTRIAAQATRAVIEVFVGSLASKRIFAPPSLLGEFTAQRLRVAPGDRSLIYRNRVGSVAMMLTRTPAHTVGEMDKFMGDGHFDAALQHARLDEDEVAEVTGQRAGVAIAYIWVVRLRHWLESGQRRLAFLRSRGSGGAHLSGDLYSIGGKACGISKREVAVAAERHGLEPPPRPLREFTAVGGNGEVAELFAGQPELLPVVAKPVFHLDAGMDQG